MPSAATLRLQIEHFLEDRFPAALTPAPRALCPAASTGIGPIDELLQGGLPVGAISEAAGATSSGRTSLALSFLAQRTAEGRVCAWIDPSDALDPESAAAGGVALPQLLWVRCGNQPATPADPLWKQHSARRPGNHASENRKNTVWTRLDQALRATDLLLQAGGFAAIVLDLGSIPRENAARIPLATWFRFRQAAERTRGSLLVLSQAACAQSSATVVLECTQLQANTLGSAVLSGFTAQVRRARERFAPVEIGVRRPGPPATDSGLWEGRKPPVSTWSANAPWETARRAEKSA